MSGPVIFLSHSAKEEGALAALETLYAALKAGGFDVRLDKRIEIADEWRTTIRHNMSDADGAVVLLSQHALRSGHVALELGVLTQRRFEATQRGDAFALILVRLGVTNQQIEASPLNASAILELQIVDWSASAPDAVVEQLAPLIADHAVRHGPDHGLEVRLLQDMAALAPETIFAVGTSIGLRERELKDRGSKALARGLLAQAHAEQVVALRCLRTFTTPDLARTIYVLVAPHALVRADAAQVVRGRARAPQRERGAAINCTGTDVPQLYVRRASFDWKTIVVSAKWSNLVVEDILDEVCALVAAALDYPPGEVPEAEQLDEELGDEPPLFLLLPDPLPSAELVKELRRQFGNLVLLIRCPTADDLARKSLEGAEYVLPELGDGEEARVKRLYDRGLQRLN